ncbi:MAG: Zn-dependent oxidoreductase [Rhodopirellula sp.]|nr:Zn-dependent oxidoreductase [Rhodopirellula sp.]
MRAIGLTQYGGPEVLHLVDLPEPEPSAGEVKVRVRAAGINPVDVMVREGDLAPLFADIEPPYVPGMDISGVVDAVGDGVDPGMVGQAVSGLVDNHGAYGGYSEYICLPVTSVIPVPEKASFPEAASFLMNAMTARNALDALALSAGATVLVTGAAGAVGTYALGLGNNQGLRMVALASAADGSFLRSVGASDFVARGDFPIEAIRQFAPEGVDAVIDAAGLGDSIVPAIGDHGSLIALRPRDDGTLERGVRIKFVNVRERAADHAALKRLGKQVESGLLPLRVAGVYEATDAVAGHQRFDKGKLRGRLILTFD